MKKKSLEIKDKLNLPIKNYEILEGFEDDKEDSDERFKRVKVWIAHTGENLNETSFTRESLLQMSETLPYVPIVGYVKKDSYNNPDFAGHERDIILSEEGLSINYLGVPYGFMPENPNVKLEIREGKEWLTGEGYLWTKFEKALDIFDNNNGQKGQSMEIEEIEGDYDDDGVLTIEHSKLSALCILGDDSLPAMNGSTIEYFEKSDFKQELKKMFEEFTSKEGEKVKLNKKDFEVKVETEKKVIEFETKTVKTGEPVKGVNGEETITYEVTYDEEGKETNRKETKREVTKEPVTEVIVEEKDDDNDQPQGSDNAKDDDKGNNPAGKPNGESEEIKELKAEVKRLKEENKKLKEESEGYALSEKETKLDSYKDKLSDDSYEALKGKLSSYSIADLEREIGYTIFKQAEELDNANKGSFTSAVNFNKDNDGKHFGELEQFFK